ncbi:uncharacterized protein METZ01_LOCUS365496, partial [marine metagenome]
SSPPVLNVEIVYSRFTLEEQSKE